MLVPKCIYPNNIFAKCTRLACLLSFGSLFDRSCWINLKITGRVQKTKPKNLEEIRKLVSIWRWWPKNLELWKFGTFPEESNLFNYEFVHIPPHAQQNQPGQTAQVKNFLFTRNIIKKKYIVIVFLSVFVFVLVLGYRLWVSFWRVLLLADCNKWSGSRQDYLPHNSAAPERTWFWRKENCKGRLALQKSGKSQQRISSDWSTGSFLDSLLPQRLIWCSADVNLFSF